MSKYDGTQTQKNLEAAFAGESEAMAKSPAAAFANFGSPVWLLSPSRSSSMSKKRKTIQRKMRNRR